MYVLLLLLLCTASSHVSEADQLDAVRKSLDGIASALEGTVLCVMLYASHVAYFLSVLYSFMKSHSSTPVKISLNCDSNQ